MKVRDIMDTNVIAITEDTTYETVVKLLLETNASGLPVLNKMGAVVGLVAEKDTMRVMFPRYQNYYEHPEAYTKLEDREAKAKEIRNQKAKVFMRTNVIIVSPDDAILKVGGLMLAHQMSRLPVVENGKVVGVISRRMISRALAVENFGEK